MESKKKESGLDYKSLTLNLSRAVTWLIYFLMVFLVFVLVTFSLRLLMFWLSIFLVTLASWLSGKLTKELASNKLFFAIISLSLMIIIITIILPSRAKIEFSQKDCFVYSLETGSRLSSVKGSLYHQYQALTRFDVREVPPKKRVLVLRNSRCPVCQQLYLELLPETDWFRVAINEPGFWLRLSAGGADINLAIDNQIYHISMSQIWLNLYNKKTDEIEALFRRIIPMLETHSRADLLEQVAKILPPGVVLVE